MDDLSKLTREQLLQIAAQITDLASKAEDDKDTAVSSGKFRNTFKDSVVQRLAAEYLVHLRHTKNLSFADIGRKVGVTAARIGQIYHSLVGKFPELDVDETSSTSKK